MGHGPDCGRRRHGAMYVGIDSEYMLARAVDSPSALRWVCRAARRRLARDTVLHIPTILWAEAANATVAGTPACERDTEACLCASRAAVAASESAGDLCIVPAKQVCDMPLGAGPAAFVHCFSGRSIREYKSRHGSRTQFEKIAPCFRSISPQGHPHPLQDS